MFHAKLTTEDINESLLCYCLPVFNYNHCITRATRIPIFCLILSFSLMFGFYFAICNDYSMGCSQLTSQPATNQPNNPRRSSPTSTHARERAHLPTFASRFHAAGNFGDGTQLFRIFHSVSCSSIVSG